ncbi:MAG: hypothetical protein JKY43_08150 [Phycisphaerales bacterium]|nr:hypothetical protein [Phycisphaerales bacterium]
MSQFGMQMPGGGQSNKSTPDVYTALIFLGVVAMTVAVGMLWVNGAKLSPEAGNALSVQEAGKIRINN